MKKIIEAKEVAGADISKLTFDAHLYCKSQHKVFSNDNKGFRMFIHWITKVSGLELNNVLICFEHTGLYSYPLASFLSKKAVQFCMIPGLEIKRSMGVARGKNDRVDSMRIAEYAYLRRNKITAYTMPSDHIFKMKKLISLRERVVKNRAGYKADLKEIKSMLKRKDNELLFKTQEQIINHLTKQIERLEAEITSIIKSDTQMDKLYKLITSVKGIGLILAANFLVVTDCFTKFDNGRKFACYAGIAPFEHQSGTSLKVKSRVNHMANKNMKKLLNISAISAIGFDPELRKYYKDRVNSGKSKMSTMNIIRNKIVHRVFAVVKRGTPYVPLHQHIA